MPAESQGPEPDLIPDPGGMTPEQLKETAKSLPDLIASFKASRYEGQFPHPDIIKGWEEQCPGSADRILKMAESQQAHRHELEKASVFGSIQRSKQGLTAGFTIAVLFLLVSGYLIGTGHDIAGTILGSIDLVALVAVFVIGRDSQKLDRQSKSDERSRENDNPEQSDDLEGRTHRISKPSS